MAPDEYMQALDKALADLEDTLVRRDLLTAQIAGLKETVRVLAGRVNLDQEKNRKVAQLIALVDSATPKLTDMIRSLLSKSYPSAMTAVEVRNEIEDSSDDISVSLSACHAALKRMLSDQEVELGAQKGGKPTYRRVLKFENLSNLRALYENAASALGSENTSREDSVREIFRRAQDAKNTKEGRKTFGQRIAGKD